MSGSDWWAGGKCCNWGIVGHAPGACPVATYASKAVQVELAWGRVAALLPWDCLGAEPAITLPPAACTTSCLPCVPVECRINGRVNHHLLGRGTANITELPFCCITPIATAVLLGCRVDHHVLGPWHRQHHRVSPRLHGAWAGVHAPVGQRWGGQPLLCASLPWHARVGAGCTALAALHAHCVLTSC